MHQPQQHKMRWEKDGVRRQKSAFRMFDISMPKSFNPMLPRSLPSHDATSRKPVVELTVHTYFKRPRFLFTFSKPLLFPLLQNTPNLKICFTPLSSPSPLLLVVAAGSVFETSSFKMYNMGIFHKSKMHQQKDVNGRVPAKMAGGILEEGSQNRLPAGPLNPFALG